MLGTRWTNIQCAMLRASPSSVTVTKYSMPPKSRISMTHEMKWPREVTAFFLAFVIQRKIRVLFHTLNSVVTFN